MAASPFLRPLRRKRLGAESAESAPRREGQSGLAIAQASVAPPQREGGVPTGWNSGPTLGDRLVHADVRPRNLEIKLLHRELTPEYSVETASRKAGQTVHQS